MPQLLGGQHAVIKVKLKGNVLTYHQSLKLIAKAK